MPTPGPLNVVDCTKFRLVINCIANTPYCKWDAVHMECIVNPDPNVAPLLPCSYSSDKYFCDIRPASDGCEWYTNIVTGTGSCIRSSTNRRTTGSPTSGGGAE